LREAAEYFKTRLEGEGFTCTLREAPEYVKVGFYSPEVQRRLLELPYRKEIVEAFMPYTVGEASFNREFFNVVVPVVSVRHPLASGYIHKAVYIEYFPVDFYAVDFICQDGLKAVVLRSDKVWRVTRERVEPYIRFIVRMTRQVSIQLITTMKADEKEVPIRLVEERL
jgi:hypothetical protein